MSTTIVSTVSPVYTNTRASLITNSIASSAKQNNLFNGVSLGGAGSSTSSSGFGILPSYLPATPSVTAVNAGATSAKTISGINNISAGIGLPAISGGIYKRRKSKRRKSKRRKSKRRKSKKRKTKRRK
jgi:hypothetical protein